MNVVPTPPNPPAITNLTTGNGQVSVAFSTPMDQGTAPITSYTVTASGGGGQVATGPGSPITVFGLTTGQQYAFAVTATNAAGTSVASDLSDPIVVGSSPPKISMGRRPAG